MDEFDEGYNTRYQEAWQNWTNPYEEGSPEWTRWQNGFERAEYEIEELEDEDTSDEDMLLKYVFG